jgi:hypothetical protein
MQFSEELTVALGVPEGETLVLDAPYPNPVANQMNVAIAVARDQNARVSLWDILGREVAIVYDGPVLSGSKQSFSFSPEKRLPAGTYLLRVQTENEVKVRTVTMVP